MRVLLGCAVVFFLFLSGCTPTVYKVDRKAMEAFVSEERRKVEEEAYQRGYQDGVKEFERMIAQLILDFGERLFYSSLVEMGVVDAPRVALVYRPAEVSGGGRVFSGPRVELEVVEPPRFRLEKALAWWQREEAGFCFFLLFSGREEEAVKVLARLEKPDWCALGMVRAARGGAAVMAKVPVHRCEEAVKFFRQRGLEPLKLGGLDEVVR
ncbi:MAG: hypothetical protein QW650_01100 [Thermofilum sp.]